MILHAEDLKSQHILFLILPKGNITHCINNSDLT